MTLQPPLQTEEFQTLFELLKTGTINQDLLVLDIFDIDNVDSSVLPHLAVHLNVNGAKGYNICTTEGQRRELLKKALLLHCLAGTPEGVKLACECCGFPIASIEENPGLFYDGSFLYDGSETYSGIKWARFSINWVSDPTPDQLPDLTALIDSWKPLRSHWEVRRIPLLYDGSALYDGTYTYSGYKD